MFRIIFLLLVLALPFGLRAQSLDELPENEQIRARRVAFITDKLNLNSEESAHFWALYNEYEAERRRLRQAQRSQRQPVNNDAEAEARIEQQFETEAALLSLKRNFYDQAKTKVPPRKLVLLPQAEREFKRQLLRTLRERRGMGPRNRGGR